MVFSIQHHNCRCLCGGLRENARFRTQQSIAIACNDRIYYDFYILLAFRVLGSNDLRTICCRTWISFTVSIPRSPVPNWVSTESIAQPNLTYTYYFLKLTRYYEDSLLLLFSTSVIKGFLEFARIVAALTRTKDKKTYSGGLQMLFAFQLANLYEPLLIIKYTVRSTMI